MRFSLALAALALVGGLGHTASASAAPAPRAAILALRASPAQLPAQGGSVVVTVRVKNAVVCLFRGQRAPTTSISDGPSVACGSGRAHETLNVAPNTRLAAATLQFYVRASNALGRSVERRTTIVEAAATPTTTTPTPTAPSSLTIASTRLPSGAAGVVYDATVAASGGTQPYSWSLVGGALPAGLALSSDGTISGTPAGPGVSTFAIEVTDAAGSTATALLSLAVNATQAPQEKTDNWSGYYVTGGPFTSVTGTFNVPSLASSRRTTDTVEWVGIDGAVDGDTSLIQAGIEERYDPGATVVHFFAWWEILPAAETLVPLTISPGDSVTVTIGEVSSGLWKILLKDDTTGQSYATTQAYNGPGSTAEWIVEAPTSAQTGAVLTLGHYVPSVTFTNLGITGAESTLSAVEMVQNRIVVSVPSGLTTNGFTVAYGGAAPSPP